MKLNSQKKKSKKLFIVCAVVGVAVFLVGLSFYLRQTTINFAEKEAYPVEQSLVKAGASRLCSDANAGRGWGNDAPWYGLTLRIDKDVEGAKAVVQAALKDNGFMGDAFSFDEQYGEWSLLDTTKNQPYSELRDGKVKLTVKVYEQKHFDSSKAGSSCLLSDGYAEGSTVIALGVNLPEFK